MLLRVFCSAFRSCRGVRGRYRVRSFCSGMGIRLSTDAAKTSRTAARSLASQSPAMKDSPSPIRPLSPIRTSKASGRTIVITGASGPPVPRTVPSGYATRRGSRLAAPLKSRPGGLACHGSFGSRRRLGNSRPDLRIDGGGRCRHSGGRPGGGAVAPGRAPALEWAAAVPLSSVIVIELPPVRCGVAW